MSLVLTLNAHGVPTHWSTWQDAVVYKTKGVVAWEMGEQEFEKFGGNSRMTGERSSIKYSTIMAVRGDHYPKKISPVLNNRNLFGRDRHICAYCGKLHKEDKLTRDHIIPTSRGGGNTWTNCVTSCKSCNNYKNNFLLEEIGMELLYVPYIPSREEALILRNRNILADQMEFLQRMLPKHSRLLIEHH